MQVNFFTIDAGCPEHLNTTYDLEALPTPGDVISVASARQLIDYKVLYRLFKIDAATGKVSYAVRLVKRY